MPCSCPCALLLLSLAACLAFSGFHLAPLAHAFAWGISCLACDPRVCSLEHECLPSKDHKFAYVTVRRNLGQPRTHDPIRLFCSTTHRSRWIGQSNKRDQEVYIYIEINNMHTYEYMYPPLCSKFAVRFASIWTHWLFEPARLVGALEMAARAWDGSSK
jgi:hypothetical protein